MPPRRPGPPHHPRKPAPSSAVSRLIDEQFYQRLLGEALPSEDEREFVARCLAREGPIHHRAASYALLMLLSRVAELTGAKLPICDNGVRVPLQLPPHRRGSEHEDDSFPLRLPASAAARVSGDEKEQAAIEDSLIDGPPHHALANVVMASLLDAILEKLEPKA